MGYGTSVVFIYIFIAVIVVQVIYALYKNSKTGYLDIQGSSKKTKAYQKEYIEADIQAKLNGVTREERRKIMKEIAEKHSWPGSESYKKKAELTRRWEAGERW